MKILSGKEQEYRDWYNKNLDSYGHACFTFAERWAVLMEKAMMNSEYSPLEVIEKRADALCRVADTEGITGFMYGSAVAILSQCWEYGEEFSKWHSKQYRF